MVYPNTTLADAVPSSPVGTAQATGISKDALIELGLWIGLPLVLMLAALGWWLFRLWRGRLRKSAETAGRVGV